MMMYDGMPLYPSLRPGRDGQACVRVPLFDDGRPGHGLLDGDCRWRQVTIENPCRPGERAEVLLGVDECGNLVVCVRRDPRREGDCCCRRPRRPPQPDCRPDCPPPCRPDCRPPRNGCRGRLYGSWS